LNHVYINQAGILGKFKPFSESQLLPSTYQVKLVNLIDAKN